MNVEKCIVEIVDYESPGKNFRRSMQMKKIASIFLALCLLAWAIPDTAEAGGRLVPGQPFRNAVRARNARIQSQNAQIRALNAQTRALNARAQALNSAAFRSRAFYSAPAVQYYSAPTLIQYRAPVTQTYIDPFGNVLTITTY